MEIILPIILVVLFVLLFNTIVKNYTKASKNQNDIPLDRTDTNIDFADTYEAYQETEYEADVYEINEVNCEKDFCNKAHCEDKANTTGQEDKTPLIEKTEIKKEQKEKVKKQSVPTKLIQKASNWYCVKVLTQKTGKEFFPNTLRKNDADAIFDLDRWYGYYNASTSTSAYIKRSYISCGTDSIASAFLVPALKCTKKYKRSVGFFSSGVFEPIMDGIVNLSRNGGTIQLIASPKLSEDDIQAINAGYEAREKIVSDAFTRDFIASIVDFEDEKLIHQNNYCS